LAAAPVPAGFSRAGGAGVARASHLQPTAADRRSWAADSRGPTVGDHFLAVSFLRDLVLGAKILDDLVLLPVDQAGKDGQEKLPSLQDEFHRWSNG
jgi:hypothetical protein